MSIFKPLVFFLVVLAWGRWATILDKDAIFFHQTRSLLNLGQVLAAILAFWLWIWIIPWFWIGLPVALLIIIGAGSGYATFRNKRVPDHMKWSLSADFVRQWFVAREAEKAARDATMRFIVTHRTGSNEIQDVPRPDHPHYEAHVEFEKQIETMLTRHAQRLELAGTSSEFTVKILVDGVAYPLSSVPIATGMDLIDYLKTEAGLDIEDRRKRQHGQCEIDAGDLGKHTLDIKTAGSTRGIVCTIDMDRSAAQLDIPLDQLGLIDSQLQQLKPVIDSVERLVLVGCPPDQGRTTTLYALTGAHDPYTMDIHSIEATIERSMEGVTHHAIEEEPLAKMTRTRLLRDPAVLTIANVADEQTAKLLADAAADGKRIYAGIRADNTFHTLKIWLNAVGDPRKVAEGLAAVISQRLIRKICTTCRQGFKPDPAALRKLNLPPDKVTQLFKSTGKVLVRNKEAPCPSCHGIGYLGRVAVFEVMIVDADARGLIAANDLEQLRKYLRRNKMLWLQETALAKVVVGLTSINEVMRVLGAGEKDQKPKSDKREPSDNAAAAGD